MKMSLFRREGLPSLYMHRVWLTRHVTTNVTTLASVVFSPEGKNIVSGSYDQTIKESLGCRCQHALTPQTLGPNLTAPVFVAASMELKGRGCYAHEQSRGYLPCVLVILVPNTIAKCGVRRRCPSARSCSRYQRLDAMLRPKSVMVAAPGLLVPIVF